MDIINKLGINIYADGADLESIEFYNKSSFVKGFTTNPSLMKSVGVTDYKQFAKKILSIVFLIYLGLKTTINKSKLEFDKKSNTKGGVTSFLQGFSISILNPKIFIWFVAIYSQFMSIDNDIVFNSYLVLTAGIVDAAWYFFLTLLKSS